MADPSSSGRRGRPILPGLLSKGLGKFELFNMINRIKFFLKESQIELKKVTWPPMQVLRRTTLVVILLMFILAIYFGIADVCFSRLLSLFAR